MLSDEEKKAIEWLKKADWFSARLYSPTILNLIEKQSKEIEELKDESKEYQIGFAQGCYEKDLDWEDKIKAKIEIRKEEKENCKDSIEEKYLLREIYVLQSLLEKEE